MGDEVLMKFCSNCKRDVPAANFVMHNVHCQRNLALCTKCDEPIPLVEFAAHNAKMHVSIDCTACGQQLEKMKLADHLKTSCSLRAMCCSYCDIDTEAKHIAEHENYCGSRTEKCGECGEFVMLKYKQLHLDSNHNFLKLEDEPGPTASWNKPRQSASLLNDLSRRRKVMNSEQDINVRPNSSNRLSPSKRTNDMPQVNSAAVGIVPKALHKPAIKKEEPERISEASPYHAAVSMLRGLDVSGEMVALPCEFCDAMVPANQLVVHETGCRPDLACFKPDSGLPCELCGGMYPPHALLSHQSVCETLRDVRVNELGLRSRETRKQQNVTPGKPVANITPVQGFGVPGLLRESNSGLASGISRHTASTGAVPKQKAGIRVPFREVPEEVSRTPPTAVTKPRPRNMDPRS